MNKLKRILFNKHIALKSQSVIAKSALIDNQTIIEGHCKISNNVNLQSSMIGSYSYVGSNSLLPKTIIGRYSSIGWNVCVIPGDHPTTKFVSSSPVFYTPGIFLPKGKRFSEYRTIDGTHYLHIGNDVWIGCNVLIRGGISIGDGAVVGMGSVVTKDVPPYAIVAGNPAKLIRFRFDQKTMEALLTLKWWDWDAATIQQNASDFSDIDAFLSSHFH